MPTLPISATGVIHGEILTREWVAEMMLDLAGYTPDRNLAEMTIVEPAAGDGAFVGPIMRRLLESAERHGMPLHPGVFHQAVRLYDIQERNTDILRDLVESWLPPELADTGLAQSFVIHGDYLLQESWLPADVIVGNPPYIRYDDLREPERSEYRATWKTMGGRGDLFVGFFEAGLRLLKPEGVHVFVCADRWMRNDYGKNLRHMITTGGYAVDLVLTCHDTDVFHVQVSAYPAITVLRRGEQGSVVVANATDKFTADDAPRFTEAAREHAHVVSPEFTSGVLHGWPFTGKAGWPTGNPALLEWLDTLTGLPTIEATGARIGIGIATGADATYVVKTSDPPDVEPDRLLPLAHTNDIRGGRWEPKGYLLVNPWTPDGPVNLDDYPRMRAYLENHPVILQRNVAKRNPATWWRTIDRVNYRLLERPLILLQDMKAQVTPVVAPAGVYPHHNLYWIDVNGSGWEPEVLAGVLLCEQVEAQIAARCVLMRGGTLRMQAQYLRQVHIPAPDQLTDGERAGFASAYRNTDRDQATRLAVRLLGKKPA